jgi:hypothetical protein
LCLTSWVKPPAGTCAAPTATEPGYGTRPLANLSGLPERAVDAIEAALKGAALVPAGQAMTITRSCRTANVAAVCAVAVKLGLPLPSPMPAPGPASPRPWWCRLIRSARLCPWQSAAPLRR